jgi:hypothetical protein
MENKDDDNDDIMNLTIRYKASAILVDKNKE